jgi:hypothetical protein
MQFTLLPNKERIFEGMKGMKGMKGIGVPRSIH